MHVAPVPGKQREGTPGVSLAHQPSLLDNFQEDKRPVSTPHIKDMAEKMDKIPGL